MSEVYPSQADSEKDLIDTELKKLETELQTFDLLLPQLLETNRGDWVLIKKTELGGLFPEQRDALNTGYEKYGLEGFLVQQVLEEQPTYLIGYSEAA